jgi:hypothetical protein
MKNTMCLVAALLVAMCGGLVNADAFDGGPDNERDDLGYYYAITGGKFVNGQTVTGKKDTGGSMNYILDDPAWGSYPLDVWNKDGWFDETAGLALTMKSGGSTVYDNFNNDAGDFYTTPAGQATAATPGMYRGYSMSNNFDWIYAGFFHLAEDTTIDTIIGYFDPYAGFDPDSAMIDYRVNIFSSFDADNGYKTPSVASFTGDVLSSDNTAGMFSWADTGVDRIFGDDYGNIHDDIWLLQYTLDTPITLDAGDYFFSHDAIIVPVPAAALLGLLGLSVAGARLRKRM